MQATFGYRTDWNNECRIAEMDFRAIKKFPLGLMAKKNIVTHTWLMQPSEIILSKVKVSSENRKASSLEDGIFYTSGTGTRVS